MHAILREISGVLGSSIPDLTSNPLVQHYINSSNAKPIKQTVYHACHHHRQEIEKQVEKMLRNGIIEASISPWASPVVLVTKADDTLQLCIDLSKTTIKDCYRLPHIEDNLAFTTHIGLLQYIHLTFGSGNAPASFQRLLELVLQDYIGKVVFRYIEGILIFSATFEDHLSHVAKVLQTLREAYLRVQIDKSQFARNSVEFLGHLITPEGIGPNKRNMEAVTSFLTPTKMNDAHAFLGLYNYYGRFIKNYSVLAGLLLQILKKMLCLTCTPPPPPPTTRIISGFERKTNGCTHFGLPELFNPIYIVLDFTLLRYNMVKKESLSMADGSFQRRRKSTPSKNEKHCH